MQIDFNLLVLFHFFVVFQGFTTCVLLWNTGKEKKQNHLLSLLVLAMTLQTLDSFLISAGIYRDNHSLYFFPSFFSWSYGPLFYFYIQLSSKQHIGFGRKQLVHFIPVGFQFLFYLIIFVQSLEFKTWFWINVHQPVTRYVDFYGGVVLVFVYLYLSLDQIKKSDKRLKQFLIALSVFYLIAFFDPMVNHLYLPQFSPKFYLIQYIIPIFTFWLSLRVYLSDQKEVKLRTSNVEYNPKNYQRISEAIREHHLYLNPELSLPELAAKVELNTSIVSASINLGSGLSFNDFVNQYRVDAVKSKINNGEHLKLTLLGIALDSGFNSKNTFNRAFKKFVGQSPSEYVANSDNDSLKSSVKL